MNAPKDAKRQEIKDRIAAAQARNEQRAHAGFADQVGEKAIAAKDSFTAFAKEHPVATVAGGLAIGVLIAGMFKGPRHAAYSAGAKTAGLAALGAEVVSAFAASAMGSAAGVAHKGGEMLDDVTDAIGDSTRSLKRSANYRAGNAGDSARIAARDVGKSLARSFRRH